MLEIVADVLERRGSMGWLVGGSVRDLMLGRYSPDLDVVVADEASAVAKQVSSALDAPWFALSERYPTYRVLGKQGYVDVAEVRGDILADLAQRDFTVNAMAVPVAEVHTQDAEHGYSSLALEPATLIDPHGGAAHLRRERLVAVSDDIFADDPLRLMRAVRFQHALGLRLDRRLRRKVRTEAARLREAAAERVAREMSLTLEQGCTHAAHQEWVDLGLLEVFLPELGGERVQGRKAGGSAADFRCCLARLDDALARPEEWFPDSAASLREHLASAVDGVWVCAAALRLAALLSGLTVKEVRGVGRRLKLSGTVVSLLSAVSRCVEGSGGVVPASGLGAFGSGGGLPVGGGSPRDEILYLWTARPWEPEVVVLATAISADQDAVEAGRSLLRLHAEREADVRSLPVDGNLLMRELSLEEGPVLGRVLREARLAWESGEAGTTREVLAAARRALED